MTNNKLTHWIVTASAEELLNEEPTNYRRWWNSSLYAVEEGGAPQAGDWTIADDQRLHALIDHAHKLGYWVRFYTLDGFAPAEDQGWGMSYNFGSQEDAVIKRWKAAIAAGVNFIATDQYEELATYLKQIAQDLRRPIRQVVVSAYASVWQEESSTASNHNHRDVILLDKW
jgi:hypothetical protein